MERWSMALAHRVFARISGLSVDTVSIRFSHHREIAMKGITHVGIGVSDMARSLPFYRDLLGLEVLLDTEEKVGEGSRHAGYVRWGKDGFLVLSQTLGRQASGKPLRPHQVGIHHFAFAVDDLETRVEKLKSAGVKILIPPYADDGIAYGERSGKVLTCLFEDPDGTILQFDQPLS
jgi:catechol 2,3-dioxygenase-like lactoylglutathione lyase family enzyme